MELDKEYSVVAAAPHRSAVDRYALRIPLQVYQLLQASDAVVEIELDVDGGTGAAVLHVDSERFQVSAVDTTLSDSVTDCYTIDSSNRSNSSGGILTYEGKVSRRLQVFGSIEGMMSVAKEKTELEHEKRGANKVVRIKLPRSLVKAKAAEAKEAEERAAEARAAEAKAAKARAAEARAATAKKTSAAKKVPAPVVAKPAPSSSSSSNSSSLFVRLVTAPAGVSFEAVSSFFGGIKIADIYVHCGSNSVYVQFESANGRDLALQRSGEEIALAGSSRGAGNKRVRGEAVPAAAAAAVLVSYVDHLETFFVKGSCLRLTAKVSTIAACALVLRAGMAIDSPLPLPPRLLALLADRSPSYLMHEWLHTAGLSASSYALDASYIGGCLPGEKPSHRRKISEAVISHDDRSPLHLIISPSHHPLNGSAAPSLSLAQMFMEDGSAELYASRKGSSSGDAQLGALICEYAEAAGLLDDTWVQHLLCNDDEIRASGAYTLLTDYVSRAREMCEGILAAYWTHSIRRQVKRC